ncbi:MAG TPA: CDP-alcohol phosphatidyltransferase family protein [Clostridiales bacterium]|nr:CDP-alcohol phosphatidyltransferase family protein [Clostridiales bacterium]
MITPNMLTSLRIALVPPMIYSYLYMPYYGEKMAFFIFAISAMTDILDGHIARKHDMITKLGTILDPFADKMMLITVLTMFVLRKKINHWILVIVAFKELIMVLGGYLLYNNDTVIPANIYGKISTFVFYVSGFATMLGFSFAHILMYIFVVLNIGTMFIYLYRFATSKV